MSLSMGILAGIAAALCWGSADFFAKMIVDRFGKNGDLKALFWTRVAGLIPLIILFVIMQPALPPEIVPALILLGAIDFVAYYSFYRGVSKGEVSIVCPVSSAWGAVTVLIGFAFIGETLDALRIFGIAAAVIGVMLTSTDLSKLRKGVRMSSGASEALVAMLGWGIMWALIGVWGKGIGWLMIIFGTRVITSALIGGYAGVRRIRISDGVGAIALLILVGGMLDATGYLFASWGMGGELVSIVASISATYPAVTVLLAAYFLREKLALNQLVGVLAILAGVAALAA